MLITMACRLAAPKVRVTSLLIPLVAGLAIDFLPRVVTIGIGPHITLEMVPPPLFFSTAVHMPTMDFCHEMQTVTVLAIPLIFLLAFTVGFVTN